MRIHTSRGFIPLVAIVLIGLVMAAGGAVVAVSVHKPNSPDHGRSQETDSAADLAPVSPRVATSTAHETPARFEEQGYKVKAVISSETQALCSEAKKIDLPLPKQETSDLAPQTAELIDEQIDARNSLIGHVHLLCNELIGGDISAEDLRETEQRVHEKWTLWLKVHAASASSEQRQKDIENGTR